MLPRCRLLLTRSFQSESWLENSQIYFRCLHSSRTVSWKNSNPKLPHGGRPGDRLEGLHQTGFQSQARKKPFLRAKSHRLDGIIVSDPSDTIPIIKGSARDWAYLPHVHRRLESFGIPRNDLPDLLSIFLEDIRNDMLSDEALLERYEFDRFVLSPTQRLSGQRLDQVLTQLFFTWASDPHKHHLLRPDVPQSTLDIIKRLYTVADLSFPADRFPTARSMRRKVIMHVGPTNSGKTHMALRALAAAPSGLYAGPLRLLAHEIWERLNKGRIVPLGVEPDPGAKPDTSINSDIIEEKGSRPTVRMEGNPKYARPCNLRTGEEFRIVDDQAPLVSCTVEMAWLDRVMDVAVVDEIQMIADPDRGSGWTMAVLGLAAQELHLCGEETAVPIIKELLKNTGDEFIVHRYERLTPLDIEDESLGGDLSRIKKGDCLVTFSRNSIFALKTKVEEATGLTCAVAYGKLPPEIRSEQAALFNDPTSGYEVIVASDAIGMGLNLKIKRVVFDTLDKYNGQVLSPLSISQIKQIAGRAGRYGLHGKPGGLVTTLNDDDLPRLRAALATPADGLAYAVLDPSETWMGEVAQALPPTASTRILFEVASYVAKVRSPFRAALPSKLEEMSKFLDTRGADLLLSEKLLFRNAPLNWREPALKDALAKIAALFKTELRVDLVDVLSVAPFQRTLQEVETMMTGDGEKDVGTCAKALQSLENFHRVLVLYLWLSFRNQMAFHQTQDAYTLKARVEQALEWCLCQLSSSTDFSEFANFGLRKAAVDGLQYRQTPKSAELRDQSLFSGVAAAAKALGKKLPPRPE